MAWKSNTTLKQEKYPFRRSNNAFLRQPLALKAGPVFAINTKDSYRVGRIVNIDVVSWLTTGYLLIRKYDDSHQYVVTLDKPHQEDMACTSCEIQGIVVEYGVSSDA